MTIMITRAHSRWISARWLSVSERRRLQGYHRALWRPDEAACWPSLAVSSICIPASPSTSSAISLSKVIWEEGRVAAKVSRHWLQWRAPNSPLRVPLPVDRSQNPTTCLIPGPVRPMAPVDAHNSAIPVAIHPTIGEDLSEMWPNHRAKFHADRRSPGGEIRNRKYKKVKYSKLSIQPYTTYGGIKMAKKSTKWVRGCSDKPCTTSWRMWSTRRRAIRIWRRRPSGSLRSAVTVEACWPTISASASNRECSVPSRSYRTDSLSLAATQKHTRRLSTAMSNRNDHNEKTPRESTPHQSWPMLTLSPPIPLTLYALPYLSGPLFLICDIRALWRSGLSARAPECQKLKMVG